MAAKDMECPLEFLAVSEANNHLAVHLYKLLAKEKKNVFFSPFSLSTAFAMLFCGCESKTAEEMRYVLGYAAANIKDQDIKLRFQGVLEEIETHSSGYTLASANAVLVDKLFSVKQEFKSLLEDSFKALFQDVDFQNESEEAVQTVNAWVAEKTDGLIQKLLTSPLNSTTVMIILNAVYFKGFWLNRFAERDTFLQYFYNSGIEDDAKQVEMMHLKEKFPYAEKESFKVLQLPYKSKRIAMSILLPHSRTGLDDLEATLTPDLIKSLKHEIRERKVEVSLPKFRLEYSKPLKEPFQVMGMNKAFSAGADFGGINDSDGLLISQVFHKAVLEVNEEGAEAAAATAIQITKRCLSFDPEFIVDHPFLFFIHDLTNDLILFMGRVEEL